MVEIWRFKSTTHWEMTEYALAVFTLFLNVYDVASFFSEDEIAAIFALLQLPTSQWYSILQVHYDYNPDDRSRKIGEFFLAAVYMACHDSSHRGVVFCIDFRGPVSTKIVFQTLRDPIHDLTAFKVIIDCDEAKTDEPFSNYWTQLDLAFTRIGVRTHQAQFLFGFCYREAMVSFARTILENKMPYISRAAEVRFSLRYPDKCRWFQASLDSEEVRGELSIYFTPHAHTHRHIIEPKEDLAKVYL